MNGGPWAIKPLGKGHDREAFDCGESSLDEYLRRYAGQHARKHLSKTYVALSPPTPTVLGFYSLATGSIEFEDLPSQAAAGLPTEYPIPTAHIARLAVDRRAQGQGLGGILLWDALGRILGLAGQIGICAVTVDALHDRARAFYAHHGFEPLRDDPLHLYLLTATARRAIT